LTFLLKSIIIYTESEGKQMIHCPNCDSNYISLTWQDTDNYIEVHTKEYECYNCGCVFEVDFVAEKKAKILDLPIDKQPKV
jgi:hypothetical protein